KPILSNVYLPQNIYQSLVEYYSTLYNLMTPSVNNVVTQFGRLRIGADIYGSKIVPRYVNRSYIRAKFIAYEDNTVDIYLGQIQFFFQHKFLDNTFHLAYIRWYWQHQTRRHYLSLKDDERCDIEIWQEKFYSEAKDCIIPVQRILGCFIPSSYKFKYSTLLQNVLVVILTNKRFNI